jgi:hypothetical protein
MRCLGSFRKSSRWGLMRSFFGGVALVAFVRTASANTCRFSSTNLCSVSAKEILQKDSVEPLAEPGSFIDPISSLN